MDSIKTIVPIFIGKTHSFWLGIVPTAVTTFDLLFQYLGTAGNEPIADAIATVFGVFGSDLTGDQIASFMQKLYPLYLLIFAQQRGTFSGAIPRPYTVNPAKEMQISQVVEDGKSAFEAGQKAERVLRQRTG